MKNLLDKVRNYIVRYHSTRPENIPSILKNGIRPSIGNYQTKLGNDFSVNAVFTDTDGEFGRYHDLPAIELHIPKEEYRRLRRLDYNPEVQRISPRNPKTYWQKEQLGKFRTPLRELQSVDLGGRTDIFLDEIRPEWIANPRSAYELYMLNALPWRVCKGQRCRDYATESDAMRIFERLPEDERSIRRYSNKSGDFENIIK